MRPELRIFHESGKLSRHAANLFVEFSNRAIFERGRFLIVLNGGKTPVPMFELLASEFRERVDWSKVHVFWGDERCVPPGDSGSNYRQAMDLLFSHVPMPQGNIHRAKGELAPFDAVTDFELTLKAFADGDLDFPRFDLVFLGLGEDGHTASLFPGSVGQVHAPVVAVTANYQDRPANRISLTQVVFNKARAVVFMATGESKAKVLAEVLSDRYNPEKIPAQRIDPQNGQLIWLVDESAAGRLPRKVKGFKICEG